MDSIPPSKYHQTITFNHILLIIYRSQERDQGMSVLQAPRSSGAYDVSLDLISWVSEQVEEEHIFFPLLTTYLKVDIFHPKRGQ